jgi:hypothetical protein
VVVFEVFKVFIVFLVFEFLKFKSFETFGWFQASILKKLNLNFFLVEQTFGEWSVGGGI